MRVSAATFSSPDALRLAAFYERLLGWSRVDESDGWVRLRPPGGGAGLSFHHEDHYVAPAWPSAPGEQLMMVHLDIAVDDLEASVVWATDAGASLADHQPQPQVRVMLDPDGHPFCLFVGSSRGEFDLVEWNGMSAPDAEE
jgi:catechol 2,3-dioxygenase-like lactoylglutathione lyase family enzyme